MKFLEGGRPGRGRAGGVVAGLALGLFLGLSGVAAYHLASASLLCGGCHSMGREAREWRLSKHKQFACIECHLPHRNIVVQVGYKARKGLNDLWHETLRDYPAYIALSKEARVVAGGNCLRCHLSTVERTAMARGTTDCLRCHRSLVHHAR